MEQISIAHIAMVTGLLIILTGLWAILTKRNIIKLIVGFSLFDTGIHIVMVSVGYLRGRTAPILDAAVDKEQAVKQIVDPVPQALVLTAIVIGLGITALMLAYALKLYQKRKTLEIKHYNDLKW
jgi:multicomponent Na+:H+ antiporter subunit C